MIKSAVAVIGANYGDEGKGSFVDYHTYNRSYLNPLVIRTNGGAQAGHTVQTPDGRRHVFSHFGSGTFCEAPTYLSEFFIVNPMLFKKERHELLSKKTNPFVLVDQSVLVTTPFDMYVNQLTELSRGANKHGSVGMGINATVERHEKIPLTINDLTDINLLTSKLYEIAEYSKSLFTDEVIALLPFNAFDYIDTIIENFSIDCQYFTLHTNRVDSSIIDTYQSVIFEASQGLMLDKEYGDFPHVTRSNCGLQNINMLLDKFNTSDMFLEVNYITRWYQTRHGAGPLFFEQPFPDFIQDETNKPNDWQGSLRFAPLDYKRLTNLMQQDLTHLEGKFDPKLTLSITCLDQIPVEKIPYPVNFNNLDVANTSRTSLVHQLVEVSDYTNYGPTRSTIYKHLS